MFRSFKHKKNAKSLLCQYHDNIILISRKDCVNDNEWNHYRYQIDVESRD